ncbi:MAG: extracellular solute-binding protein [Tepidisphaeraceae bacterium]
MNFHLGKPILVMIVLSLLSGLMVLARPSAKKGQLTVWVFAHSHHRTYMPLCETFAREHNVTVNLELLNGRAMIVRLGQLFMADPTSEEIPDVLEMEISLVGRFFRPPREEVGFLPLDDRLDQTGWRQRLVQSRLSPWQKEGVTFGVPHDVHSTTITYREDLFRQAGVDLAAAKTWKQFHDACFQFNQYWKQPGVKYRHAFELPEAASDFLQAMLLQRGVNPIDSYGKVFIDDPKVAQTLAFYATMVAGPRKVTAQTPAGIGARTKDISEGNICAFLTPDWDLTYVKQYGAAVAGTMRMMPMPVFDPTDTPTTTRGGTMMGITRACKDPDLAWKLIEYLYFSRDGLEARQLESDILPPVRAFWSDPFYNRPDPFLGGQKGGALYVELADKIPKRYVTPVSGLATLALNDCLVKAVKYVNSRGEAGLEAACQRWLTAQADDLKARMKHMEFKE